MTPDPCPECGTPATCRRADRPRHPLAPERLAPILALGAVLIVMLSKTANDGGGFQWSDYAWQVAGPMTPAQVRQIADGANTSISLRRGLLALAPVYRDDRDPSAELHAGFFSGGVTLESSAERGPGWPVPWWSRHQTRSLGPRPAAPDPGWSFSRWAVRHVFPTDANQTNRSLRISFGAMLLSAWLAAGAAWCAWWLTGFLQRRGVVHGGTRLRTLAAGAIGGVAMLLVALVPPVQPPLAVNGWTMHPVSIPTATRLTLADLRALPDTPDSDRLIARAILDSNPPDRGPQSHLCLGFTDKAPSRYTDTGIGRPWPVIVLMSVAKDARPAVPFAPARSAATAGRTSIRLRGDMLQFVFGDGAWPGRSTYITIDLADLAGLVTLASAAYWLVRAAGTTARSMRSRHRLLRGRCVACGYSLPAGLPATP